MKSLIGNFWSDEAGFVLSAELVLVSTVAVIGLVAGMSRVRGALIEEFDDVAESITSLDQSYSYNGFKGCKSFTAGSAYYEDGREVEIEFTEVYREQPCVKPLASPPQQEFIVEPLPCNDLPAPCNDCLPQPCNDCLPAPVIEEKCCPQELSPLPAPAPAPNSAATSIASPCCGSGLNAFGGDSGFVPAQKYAGIGYYGRHYQGVDGNPQKIILPYENSVYNVKRYIDTPYYPLAPHVAPRSSVW